MRVLVTGSRIFDDERLFSRIMDDFYAVDMGFQPFTIIHGGARGADNIAARWAYDNKIKTETFLPDWNGKGRAAGVIRNKEMLDSGVDIVFAFPRGEARGTKHMMKIAKEAGVRVVEN